jgi:hypothetical protein
MTSGLLPEKWIGIMPSLHPKAYHSAFLAPEGNEHFISGACASGLLMQARTVKRNYVKSSKKLCIYNLLTMSAPCQNEKAPKP